MWSVAFVVVCVALVAYLGKDIAIAPVEARQLAGAAWE